MCISNEEKGNYGEQIAQEMITNAAKNIDGDIRVYNNIILEFPSVFGNSPEGMFTTEIDHIIVTPYLVVLVETKNEEIAVGGYLEDTWILKNGEEVSNPINQNQMHKKVFCNTLGVDSNRVFTIELLLGQSVANCSSQNTNDYIMSDEDFERNLTLLLSTKYKKIMDVCLNEKLKQMEKQSEYKRNVHINNINKAKDISEWIRTHENAYVFSFLDTVKCPKCGSYMLFRKAKYVDYSRNNTRRSKQYMIGCLNYAITGCDGRVYYSKKKGEGFQKVNRISFEERSGWSEQEKTTNNILEDYWFVKRENAAIKNRLNDLADEIEGQESEIGEYKKKTHLLSQEKQSVEKEKIELKKELNKYKRLFGNIYIRR